MVEFKEAKSGKEKKYLKVLYPSPEFNDCNDIDEDSFYVRIKSEVKELRDSINHLSSDDAIKHTATYRKLIKELKQHNDLLKLIEIINGMDLSCPGIYYRKHKKDNFIITPFEDIDDIDLVRSFSFIHNGYFNMLKDYANYTNLYIITPDENRIDPNENRMTWCLSVSVNQKDFIIVDMLSCSKDRKAISSSTLIKQVYGYAKDKVRSMSESSIEDFKHTEIVINDINEVPRSVVKSFINKTKLSAADLQ